MRVICTACVRTQAAKITSDTLDSNALERVTNQGMFERREGGVEKRAGGDRQYCVKIYLCDVSGCPSLWPSCRTAPASTLASSMAMPIRTESRFTTPVSGPAR